MLLSLFPISGLISSHGCLVRTARQHRRVAACGTRLQLLPWSLPASLSQENPVKFIVIVSSSYFVLPGCGSFTIDFCQDFLPFGNSEGPAWRGLWGLRVVQCPPSPTSCVPQPPVRWAGPCQAPWLGLATAQLCLSLGEGLQQGPAWGHGPRVRGGPRVGGSPEEASPQPLSRSCSGHRWGSTCPRRAPWPGTAGPRARTKAMPDIIAVFRLPGRL